MLESRYFDAYVIAQVKAVRYFKKKLKIPDEIQETADKALHNLRHHLNSNGYKMPTAKYTQ